MKIYLDFIFIINFFFDFLLLYGTAKVLKKNILLKRLLLGSLIGTISLLFLFISLSSFKLFILKLILSLLIIIVTFGKKDILKNTIYFYLLSIILGGSLYLFDITLSYENNGIIFIKNSYILNFLLSMFISPIIIYLFIKERIAYKVKISNKYIVEIHLNEQKYILEAILDTGNNLKDPYKNRAVILIDEEIDIRKKRPIYVPYKALNVEGVIKCILPDKVIINNKQFKNCLIGLSKDKFSLNGASCILPNIFKEELC